MNFAFGEWVLYVGTAPEQKAKNAKSSINSMFMLDFLCIFENRTVNVISRYNNTTAHNTIRFGVVQPLYQ